MAKPTATVAKISINLHVMLLSVFIMILEPISLRAKVRPLAVDVTTEGYKTACAAALTAFLGRYAGIGIF